ncbi:CDGSH iron-sulfur domain-containing protein [Streptomyces sp. NPDC056883]|uniref:CDGSH iron-sulfur domain-containing protein n=1 Tax=Streptomyces sp. NPDC056883 TaxID=3345959 RepID=UPI003691B4AF
MPGAPDDRPDDCPDVRPADRDGPGRGERRAARRVAVDPQGPVLVEGPVEVVLDDGSVVRSDRFTVAVCTCRRSRTYPWCDTSHRPRERPDGPQDRSTG